MKINFDKVTNPKTIREELNFIPDKFRIMHNNGTQVEIFNINQIKKQEIDESTEEVLNEWFEYERVNKTYIDSLDEEGKTIKKESIQSQQLEYQNVIDDIILTVNNHDINFKPKTELEKLQEVIDLLLIDSLGV